MKHEKINIKQAMPEKSTRKMEELNLSHYFSDIDWENLITLLRDDMHGDPEHMIPLFEAMQSIDAERLDKSLQGAEIIEWNNLWNHANNTLEIFKAMPLDPDDTLLPAAWWKFTQLLESLASISLTQMTAAIPNTWYTAAERLRIEYESSLSLLPTIDPVLCLQLAHVNFKFRGPRAIDTFQSIVEKNERIRARIAEFAKSCIEGLIRRIGQVSWSHNDEWHLLMIKECLPEFFESHIRTLPEWKELERTVASPSLQEYLKSTSHISAGIPTVVITLGRLKKLMEFQVREETMSPVPLPETRAY